MKGNREHKRRPRHERKREARGTPDKDITFGHLIERMMSSTARININIPEPDEEFMKALRPFLELRDPSPPSGGGVGGKTQDEP